MKTKGLLFIAIIFLGGCYFASYSKVDIDHNTGAKVVSHYSRYFEGNTRLINNRVKVSVIVKITKRNPTLKEGELKPDKNSVLADFKIHLSNKTERNIYFSLRGLHLVYKDYKSILLEKPKELTLIPKAVEGIFIQDQNIDNTKLVLTLEILYVENHEYKTARFPLRRITLAELKDRKGKL